MKTKEERLINLAKTAINHGIFCDESIMKSYWNDPNEYFEDVYGYSLEEIKELLGTNFGYEEEWV